MIMNRKKLIVIGIVVMTLLALAALGYVLISGNSNNQTSTIEIQGQDDKVVTSNFVDKSPTYQNETVIYTDSDINIEYDAASSYFQITFTSIDPKLLSSNRSKAETILLEKLNIDAAQACKLKITEILPPADPTTADPKTYPLSFCPGGERFP